MNRISLLLSLVPFSLVLGCASGNCRSQVQTKAEKSQQAGAAMTAENQNPTEKIRVYKLDGSLQCNQGKAKSLQEMSKDLGGLKIYKSASKPDGLMRIQQCGTPTGMCNIYEIDRKDLIQAQKAGFKEWTGAF